MEQKKIIIFDEKMFYNARHLYNYLDRYYYNVHKVTFLQVQDATGKRHKTIDRFFNVSYDYVNATTKRKIKKYAQIVEGYEKIIAFDLKSIDDFIIKDFYKKENMSMLLYRTPTKEIVLAFKPAYLENAIQKFNPDLADLYFKKIMSESILRNDYHHYVLKPTSIKQTLF